MNILLLLAVPGDIGDYYLRRLRAGRNPGAVALGMRTIATKDH